MKIRSLSFFLPVLGLLPLFLLPSPCAAQETQPERLFSLFKEATRFDYRYPREKVYLHFDNSAYLEGDSLWYKAYVVRASSLRPEPLSKVLYVELLNADGQLMTRQTLRVDSLGQADGCISLALPVRAGYYEVRAYTRAMTNWDEGASFSRVFPVFTHANPQLSGLPGAETSLEELSIPQPETDRRVTLGAPRPCLMKGGEERLLSFYPEGGHRARGVAQQVAFKLTDGRGMPADDTVMVFTDGGHLLTEAATEHEGMGSFLLPQGFTEGYAVVKTELEAKGKKAARHPLPAAAECVAMHVAHCPEGLIVSIAANDSAATARPLLGLAMFNREQACYFDTLTAEADPMELLIPRKALREGVSRIELFDTEGRSRASRLVWCPPTGESRRSVKVRVEQNAEAYDPFSPAVVRLSLNDAAGHPVCTTVSVAVRDAEGNIVEDDDRDLSAELLLASELRGYIHRPEQYFSADDAAHRRMTDLLLMVQGWTASSFDIMGGRDSFSVVQPIEEKLIVRGTLYRENNKRQPQPDITLTLQAYSMTGDRIEGETKTDGQGRFAFESEVDFSGRFIAQFTSRNDKGKRRWGRLTLDRWFAPAPRPLFAPELLLREPEARTYGTGGDSRTELFEWTDTLPRALPTLLGEAKVKGANRYRGFTGNRYTWRGGEKHGMERATKFYNIEQECEHIKDMGLEPGDIYHLLGLLEQDFEYSRFPTADAALRSIANPEIQEKVGLSDGEAPLLATDDQAFNGNFAQPDWTYHGLPITVYLNNEPFSDLQGRFPELYSDLGAEEIRSASIVFENRQKDAVTGTTKRFSREKYKMYLYESPDAPRFREKKGVEKRRIEGFTHHTAYYAPNYRSFDLPTDRDMRRTLHWAPSVQTDTEGHAHLILFTNARRNLHLDISVRGITRNGEIINF